MIDKFPQSTPGEEPFVPDEFMDEDPAAPGAHNTLGSFGSSMPYPAEIQPITQEDAAFNASIKVGTDFLLRNMQMRPGLKPLEKSTPNLTSANGFTREDISPDEQALGAIYNPNDPNEDEFYPGVIYPVDEGYDELKAAYDEQDSKNPE